MKKKFAFTLAEVLITLTIIGVIAALTIPNLMKKYEEQQILAGIKAAYSILQNAIKLSIAENGPMSEWGLVDGWETYNAHKNFSERFIVPYLKVASVCKANWTNSNERCFASNNKRKTIWFGSGGTPVGYGSYLGPNISYMVKLSNGMDLAMGTQGYTINGQYIVGFRFVVDISGTKGGSVMGRDVFVFSANPEQGGIPSLPEGLANNNCWKAKGGKGGQMCGVNNGCGCTALIVKNSFQFPNNYELNRIPKRGDDE